MDYMAELTAIVSEHGGIIETKIARRAALLKQKSRAGRHFKSDALQAV